jgi:hypothetical protein
MHRSHFVVPALLLLAAACSAQSDPASTTTCNLDDGRQVAVRYNPGSSRTDKISNGKPFTPGGAPMTLFTDVPLTFGGATVPGGAYTLYPIPAREKWTVAVNRNVTAGAPYDEKQNIAQSQVETDQIPTPAEALEVAFSHVGQKCTLRIYIGKVATFSEFFAK